jgi:hypothetical protein
MSQHKVQDSPTLPDFSLPYLGMSALPNPVMAGKTPTVGLPWVGSPSIINKSICHPPATSQLNPNTTQSWKVEFKKKHQPEPQGTIEQSITNPTSHSSYKFVVQT